jgi:hypothetical protein
LQLLYKIRNIKAHAGLKKPGGIEGYTNCISKSGAKNLTPRRKGAIFMWCFKDRKGETQYQFLMFKWYCYLRGKTIMQKSAPENKKQHSLLEECCFSEDNQLII